MPRPDMDQQLSRRRFLGASGASTAVLVLASCAEEETSATVEPTTDVAPRVPPPPPSETLSRADFLEYLDTRAEFNMQRCHHCAQASFLTLQQGFRLPGDNILKALTPLPGIAERGETCGAVVGSLMALGLVFGRDHLEDVVTWQTSLVPARAFCAGFEKELGSTQCGDLLEKHMGRRYNLADRRERGEFIAANPGPSEVCGRVVRTAVRLAAELILDDRKPAK